MAGKASRATEFSTNTVPSETAISSSLALVMGATAAMALPPQMAVPAEMRNETLLLHVQNSSQPPAQQHGKADAGRGVEKPGAAYAKNLVEVHAESESHDGNLKQKLRQALGIQMIGMNEGEAVDKPAASANGGERSRSRRGSIRRKRCSWTHFECC